MVVVMMLGQPSRLRVVIATLLSMTRMESHDNDQHDSVDEDDDGDAQVNDDNDAKHDTDTVTDTSAGCKDDHADK